MVRGRGGGEGRLGRIVTWLSGSVAATMASSSSSSSSSTSAAASDGAGAKEQEEGDNFDIHLYVKGERIGKGAFGAVFKYF